MNDFIDIRMEVVMGGYYRRFIFLMISIIIFGLPSGFAKTRKPIDIKKFEIREKKPAKINFVTTTQRVRHVYTSKQIWTELIIRYKTKKKWIDHIEFKFYAQLGKGKKSIIIFGKSNYQNVPEGREHIAASYIHPRMLERYGPVERAVVEVWMDNELMLTQNYKGKSSKKWWQKDGLVAGMSSSFFTPFNLNAPDQDEQLVVSM